ncbi:hypothetical protein [Pseudoalteromonas aurantia]|uniref:Uncharacterized protein n=1 Tax=Pseudoalteromonas aurantia TaxID=43654 RepID=A0A5S3V5R4_9GAMM|nr:hypothetical protein [Pseudoalteromonas aurantia]TMO66610.1 hypothetical protein CWC19_15710 [Pseudoalteromonas aurantia]
MGNSIVSHHVESAARQKYINETVQKLSANAQAKVNQQAAKNLNQTLADAQTSVNSATQSTLGMLQASQRANANAQFAADEARRASRQQGVVDNYHKANRNAYNQTVSAINEGAAAGNSVRNHHAKLNAIHEARYARGNAEARAGMMTFGGAGIDAKVAYDWDEAIVFQEAVWANGRVGASSLRDGTQFALDTTKNSFKLYGNTFKRIYESYDAMLDRVNKFDGRTQSSIAFGGSLGGQILRLAASYDASFAYDNKGSFAINLAGWSGGVASSNGLAIDASLLMTEKAFTSSALNHVTGYQHTTAFDVELVEAVLDNRVKTSLNWLKVPKGLQNLMLAKEKPVSIYAGAIGGQLHDGSPSSNTKFSDTEGYWFGVSAGMKFNGTGPLLITDSLSYAPNVTSFSVNLGIFGKTVFALNNIFHKE